MADELAQIFGITPCDTTPLTLSRADIWADAEDAPERTADETYELEQRYDAAVQRHQRTGRTPRRC